MKEEKPKVSQNRQKKETIVAEVVEKLQNAKAVVFTNYEGMTHKQIEEFKKNLKKAEADLMIAKNTLLKRALSDSTFKDQAADQAFERPTATMFSYGDPVAALKELAKAVKTLKLPLIKFGIFEGRVLSEAEVLKIASLPSREVLIAQLVGGMKSPLYGLHRSLSWNLQKLVMTLKAIEQKKS